MSENKYLDQLPVDKRGLVEKHLDLVLEANKTMNLTRIENEEDGRLLHIEDSLSGLGELNGAPEGRYGDLGSGAGYPGIPLAIATGRETVLIDARQKKMTAVLSMIEALGLSDQVGVYAGRAELLARKDPESFSVLTARALSKLSVLLELASPLLKRNGRLVCYKSHVDEEEYQHALDVCGKVGMKLVSDRSFILCDEYERRILVFEKCDKSRIKLPRQEGLAQKDPL